MPRRPEPRPWPSLLMSLKSKFTLKEVEFLSDLLLLPNDNKLIRIFYSHRQKQGAKHGVFQMPTTNALGDTNMYPKTTHPKDPDSGKPVTAPRNFFTNKGKKGKNDEVYIGADRRDFRKIMPDVSKEIYVAKASYVATNNPYD